jgi:hypothetical protein
MFSVNTNGFAYAKHHRFLFFAGNIKNMQKRIRIEDRIGWFSHDFR